jgi:hypothetical protein
MKQLSEGVEGLRLSLLESLTWVECAQRLNSKIQKSKNPVQLSWG